MSLKQWSVSPPRETTFRYFDEIRATNIYRATLAIHYFGISGEQRDVFDLVIVLKLMEWKIGLDYLGFIVQRLIQNDQIHLSRALLQELELSVVKQALFAHEFQMVNEFVEWLLGDKSILKERLRLFTPADPQIVPI